MVSAMGRAIVSPVTSKDGIEGKTCRKCLEWKSLSKFSRHATSSGGRRNTCTTCEGRRAYANRREAVIEATRRWQRANPERFRLTCKAGRARRAGRLANGKVSAKELKKLFDDHGGKCAYCEVATADTVDHVFPLSRGGDHTIANLVPACGDCNRSKHAKTPDEWRARQSTVAKEH